MLSPIESSEGTPGSKTIKFERITTKTITKIGNSQGIIFDTALMELAHLKLGDQLAITLHEGGSIVLTPVRSSIEAAKAAATAKRLIRKNAELFRRLS